LVRWTIVVKNCGHHTALGVSVTDRLRKGTRVWNTGTLAAGASRTYTVTTRISRNARLGRYLNRATADGNNTEPTTGMGSTTVKSPA
jgi:uncharacterized repeat protein (TIGR01451 family)